MAQRQAARSTIVALALVWACVLLVLAFGLGLYHRGGPVSGTALPLMPKGNQPIQVRFMVQNPSPEASLLTLQLLANGKPVLQETRLLAGHASERVEYVTPNTAGAGRQMVFVLQTWSAQGHNDEVEAVPPYPPAVISSIAPFASFASLSSSAMSFVTTREFYEGSFNLGDSSNVGLVFALLLMGLLVMMELTAGSSTAPQSSWYGELRTNFGRLSWVLIIIVAGMMFTKVTLIIMRVAGPQ